MDAIYQGLQVIQLSFRNDKFIRVKKKWMGKTGKPVVIMWYKMKNSVSGLKELSENRIVFQISN